MKTSSKILIAVIMFFMSASAGAQSISKNKMLTGILNPWILSVNYQEDRSSTNYYLLSVGNEEFGKKRNGSYFESYSFFGTAEEMIEFLEEIKITRKLKQDETCSLQSKLAQEAGCYGAKNRIHYDLKVSGSTVYHGGYSFVMREKYLEDLISKIQKFEDESKGN